MLGQSWACETVVSKHPIESSAVLKSKADKNALLQYETVEILGVPVGIFTRTELTAIFLGILESQQRGWISYVNVHTINLAYTIEWFKKYLQDSVLTYCDGQGVRVGAALLGRRINERIVFSDWVYDVCTVADQTGIGVYLLGAEDIVLEKTKINLLKSYPSLKISGSHHGYFTSQEAPSIVDLINRSGAEILIVGMGMPRQEKWIQEQFNALKPRLVLNAGSCFDFIAGTKKRCPSWMGKVGIEWLFRLAIEPQRLWRRYLIGNPVFIYRIIKSRLLKKS
jgi:N-acetylglucosaminyldiphosphoundecaprenol N-acetyl-beta-D-mannosaminyltransferase